MLLLKDWIQYEELSSEDAIPGDVGETDGFNSSLYATQSSLADQLANIPDVIICPQASGEENEDVSFGRLYSSYLNIANRLWLLDTYSQVVYRKRSVTVCCFLGPFHGAIAVPSVTRCRR